MEEHETVRIAAIDHALADLKDGTPTRYDVAIQFMDICYANPGVEDLYKSTYDAAKQERFVYILASTGAGDAYLGFGSHIVKEVVPGINLVRCWHDHARWQAERLMSGLRLMSPIAGWASIEVAEAYALEIPEHARGA